MTTHPIIDPRLSPQLTELLDANEVPHEEGALLWEAEKRGYWVYLAGPNEHEGLSVSRRWEVRAVPQNDPNSGGINCWGQTARIALALLFQRIVDND